MPELRLLPSVLRRDRGRGSPGVNEEAMDWEVAKGHFDAIRAEYESLQGVPGVNTTLALQLTFEPLEVRYNRGERSRDLFDAMMSVE
jgi:hypothetical protein